MNKQEALDFINEYFTQDNHGTGYPIYFSIRDIGYVGCSEYDDADCYDLSSDGCSLGQYDTLEEAAKSLHDNHEWDVPEACLDECHEDFWDFDCIFKTFCRDNSILINPLVRINQYKGMFLLKSEAELHLQQNKHHYSNNAIVYCHHAWRSERQKDFLESLRKILEE